MARKKAKTRKVVTVTPTINHDRMKRGRTYDLLLTDDVARRVEAGALRILDERTEPVLDEPAAPPAPRPRRPATTRQSSSSVTSDTAPATAQEGDDSDDRTDAGAGAAADD